LCRFPTIDEVWVVGIRISKSVALILEINLRVLKVAASRETGRT
jgi:hypothetical protein